MLKFKSYSAAQQEVDMAKIKGLKFGDIVTNGWAGDDNPNRRGVFVKRKRDTIVLTNMKGKFWEPYNDDQAKLKKIGTIFDENVCLEEL